MPAATNQLAAVTMFAGDEASACFISCVAAPERILPIGPMRATAASVAAMPTAFATAQPSFCGLTFSEKSAAMLCSRLATASTPAMRTLVSAEENQPSRYFESSSMTVCVAARCVLGWPAVAARSLSTCPRFGCRASFGGVWPSMCSASTVPAAPSIPPLRTPFSPMPSVECVPCSVARRWFSARIQSATSIGMERSSWITRWESGSSVRIRYDQPVRSFSGSSTSTSMTPVPALSAISTWL